MPGTQPIHSTASDEQWNAILSRDTTFRNAFILAVRTTGIYCRPGCPARTPSYKNVHIYESPADAERAGYRPCKRCNPKGESVQDRHAVIVAAACRTIESAETSPRLEDLARNARMSPHHFHRTFRAATGVTPKVYADSTRATRVRDQLTSSPSVTFAIYDSGFGSNGRFYEMLPDTIGMTPTSYRAGGDGMRIRYAMGESSLGTVLVAATDRGICALYLGDDPAILAQNLRTQFPKASLIDDDPGFTSTVATVIRFIDTPQSGLSLPLDIQGTIFQHRVWQALRTIPIGTTATYSGIAEQVGSPGAVRAVARACATNNVAVAIPCHRVVRKDGNLAGYRWGLDRKRDLLERER